MIDDILTASPPPEAYRAQPMTVAELDAHPDAARLWATIKAITDWAEGEREAGYEKGAEDTEAENEAAKDDARADAIEECENVLSYNIRKLLRKYDGAISEKLAADIEALECIP